MAMNIWLKEMEEPTKVWAGYISKDRKTYQEVCRFDSRSHVVNHLKKHYKFFWHRIEQVR